MVQVLSYLAFALLVCLSSSVPIRKNVDQLSSQDILNLQKALQDVRDDNSLKGYEVIASYHGYPSQCRHGDMDVACCVRGYVNFAAWLILTIVQFEQALKEKGFSMGLPYWDGAQPIIGENVIPTARDVDRRLFQQVPEGEHTDLFEHVLHAFDYTSFCDFEVQFDVAHSTIHSQVGGRYPYSLSTLEYTVYDPIFFLHHYNVDRLLIIYRQIQRERGFASTSVGLNTQARDIKSLFDNLEPFNRDSNPFSLTRTHSSPDKARDHSVFGYDYDQLTLNGLDAANIIEEVEERQSHDRRIFAGFLLKGLGTSADVRVKTC